MQLNSRTIIALLSQMQNGELDRLASASPELLDALAAYGVIPERQQVNALDYKNALGMQNTEMPDLMRTRNATVAPSPVAYIASALRQGIGGQERKTATADMRKLLDQKQGYNRLFGQEEQQAALRGLSRGVMAPKPPPVQPQIDPLEAWLGSGFDPRMGG